jgi:alcohol dehydrogenase, propanol-preferring
MKALQYVTIGQPPRLVDIPQPTAGPGQILLKVTAAGACHSDEFIMGLPEDQYVYGLPLTLGHEGHSLVTPPGVGWSGIGYAPP